MAGKSLVLVSPYGDVFGLGQFHEGQFHWVFCSFEQFADQLRSLLREHDELPKLNGALSSFAKDVEGGTDLDGFYFEQLEIAPNSYFPRMARLSVFAMDGFPEAGHLNTKDREEMSKARLRLEAVVQRAIEVCRYVQAEEANFLAFGDAIKDVIISACIEIEAQWRAILMENNALPERPTTGDYVKMAQPMRLKEYAIEWIDFPWLEQWKPFAGWDPARPTQSISWYDGYNKLKHDAYGQLVRANLKSMLEAVSALAIMFVAQFGMSWFQRSGSLENILLFSQTPSWSIGEAYARFNAGAGGLTRTSYPL